MSAVDIHASIDSKTKREAEAVLEPLGLSVAEAFRLFLIRVAREKVLPFESFTPNAETVAAMQEARRGSLPSFTSVDALMYDLDADD